MFTIVYATNTGSYSNSGNIVNTSKGTLNDLIKLALRPLLYSRLLEKYFYYFDLLNVKLLINSSLGIMNIDSLAYGLLLTIS